MSNIARVEAFIAAWNAMDFEAVYAAMADDIVWHNIPMPPAHGVAGAKALLENFPIERCDWQVHAIAEADGRVLTERTDRFLLTSGAWAELPVMGVFEFAADGRIRHWRDYFDMGQFRAEFAK